MESRRFPGVVRGPVDPQDLAQLLDLIEVSVVINESEAALPGRLSREIFRGLGSRISCSVESFCVSERRCWTSLRRRNSSSVGSSAVRLGWTPRALRAASSPVLQRRPADPEVHGDRGERGACGVLIESDRVRLELIGVGVLRPWWFLAFSGPFWAGVSVSTKQGTAP